MDAFETLIRSGQTCRGMSFNQRVWAATARIPRGKVATYGQLAAALGSSAARAVGMALNRNPYAPGVPCHRVVGSDGRLVGFAHGIPAKEALLQSEGIEITGGRVDLAKCLCADALIAENSKSTTPARAIA